jgi:FkbM family methyltransferase
MSPEFAAQAERYRQLARFPLARGHVKRALTRLVAEQSEPPVVEGQVAGLPVRLDLSQGWDRKIFLYGLGDSRGVQAIQAVMRALQCRTAWDVGANRGNHSAAMAGYCDRLFSFEPDPTQFPRLAALLAGAPNATPVPAGLSDEPGSFPFFLHQPGASVSFSERGRGSSVEAQLITGDDFVREHEIEDLDFLKIDVEGHELKVLAGMSEVLRTQRPVIILEVLAEFAVERPSDALKRLLPDYALFGNYYGLSSRLFMTACKFGPFREGRTYTHALAVPREKLGALAGLVPA